MAKHSIRKKRRELISKVETKDVTTDSGLPYTIFTTVPKELELDEKMEGVQVWIANESRTTKAFLRSYHKPGEKSFPDGGVVVLIQGTKYHKSYFLNEVILHPSEIKLTEKQRETNRLVKEAKEKKYTNPLTGRGCSYHYSLQNGFITKEGEEIPLKDMKFENPETGRMVSYSYAKQNGII